jgi:hypothetical protein
LLLFAGLWFLLRSGRWSCFQANATEIDMIRLLPSGLNLGLMGLAALGSPRR